MSAADELTAALAEECARHTVEAFARYNAEFRAITRRAPLRFDSRDLRASQQDAIERIGLYERFVNQTVAELRERLGSRSQSPMRSMASCWLARKSRLSK